MQTKTQRCTYPKCQNEAVAWYEWVEFYEGKRFEMVCREHAALIRSNVSDVNILGRGVMHNGIAEGSGR